MFFPIPENVTQIAKELLVEMMKTSGVRIWETDTEHRKQLTDAALAMAVSLTQFEVDEEMALPDSLLYVVGTPIVFADHAGDFSPTAANSWEHDTPTDCQLSLASVANSAARQSTKVDLGANRAPAYRVSCAFELAATPTAGNVIELWWAPSPSSTAGNANPGGVSGSDAAYSGYSSNLDASIKQLDFIGDFVCTAQATATVQQGRGGILIPRYRYGSLVVYNKSGAAFHSDDEEIHVAFEPYLPTIVD